MIKKQIETKKNTIMLYKMSALFLVITLGSCSSLKQDEAVYWVNSAKVDCLGVGKMTCYQVQKGDSLDLNAAWNLFYSQIEGFDYQPGFIYKLKVKETAVENPPADASSIKYTLVFPKLENIVAYSQPITPAPTITKLLGKASM